MDKLTIFLGFGIILSFIASIFSKWELGLFYFGGWISGSIMKFSISQSNSKGDNYGKR